MADHIKHWYQKWWGIGLLMVLGLFLAIVLAFGFFLYQNIRQIRSQTLPLGAPKVLSAEEKQLIEGLNGYSLGAADPVITIVEFGDYACPYCQKSFSTIRQISLKYFSQIRYIYRDYPLTTEHSLLLAMAARCAGEQGLFWPMHDKLFINQGVADKAGVANLARQIGADLARFQACVDSEKYLDSIKKDVADADALGIKGTPAWFINGRKLEGLIPHAPFVDTIEKILNN